jgi:undecaprenyl-diphosphatase
MTIDTYTNALMQQIQIPSLITLSRFIGIITDPIVLLAAALIISVILLFKSKTKQAALLTTTTIATAIIIKFSKEIFQRARPLNALVQETSNAFPSGHTIMAVVFFGLIAYLFITKKQESLTVTITATMLTIAFTRLYLNVHWFTDVIAGFAIGAIILTLSIFIYKKLH